MIKAISSRVTIKNFGFCHAIADHVFGNLLIIGFCLLFFMAGQANGIVVVYR